MQLQDVCVKTVQMARIARISDDEVNASCMMCMFGVGTILIFVSSTFPTTGWPEVMVGIDDEWQRLVAGCRTNAHGVESPSSGIEREVRSAALSAQYDDEQYGCHVRRLVYVFSQACH